MSINVCSCDLIHFYRPFNEQTRRRLMPINLLQSREPFFFEKDSFAGNFELRKFNKFQDRIIQKSPPGTECHIGCQFRASKEHSRIS